MRNSARQLADGLHFFRLSNPIFRRDLVGEVAKEPIEQEALAAFQRSYAHLGAEFFSAMPTGRGSFETRTIEKY
jgi:hypothetical protein